MIEINKITDSKITSGLEKKYDLKNADASLFLGAFSNSEILEFIQYTLKDNHLNIEYISDNTNDFFLTDGLMKTLLFKCDTSKTEKIILPVKYSRVAAALGFDKKKNSYELRLDNYNNHCSCSEGE